LTKLIDFKKGETNGKEGEKMKEKREEEAI